MDEAVLAAEQAHVATDNGVTLFIRDDVCLDGAPASEVAPAQVSGYHIDVSGFLHDSVVDGNLLAVREVLPEDGRLGGREQGGGDGVHHAGDLRRIGPQLARDGLHVPDENARVPEIMAVLDIGFRRLLIRFLLESRHFHDLALHGIRCIDVAVTGFRTGGGDAHGDDGVSPVRRGERLADDIGKVRRLQHQRVGGRDDDVGVGMALGDLPAGVGDAGGRIPGFGFRQDLVVGNRRDLFLDDVHILLGGHHPELVRVADGQEPLHRELEERHPHPEDVDELLGAFRGGKRP